MITANGCSDQRLRLNLPKSAIFLDLFPWNDAVLAEWGLTLSSPVTAVSGEIPFEFQFRLGLARTNGLKQITIPDKLRPCPGLLPAGAALFGVSGKCPVDPSPNSPSAMPLVYLSGDIPDGEMTELVLKKCFKLVQLTIVQAKNELPQNTKSCLVFFTTKSNFKCKWVRNGNDV